MDGAAVELFDGGDRAVAFSLGPGIDRRWNLGVHGSAGTFHALVTMV